MKNIINCIVLILMASLFTSCPNSDDGTVECFTCEFEKRATSCSSDTFGPWEADFAIIDFELREGLTPQTFCNEAYPANDIECGGDCCISFQFRNVSVGSCQ